MIRHATTADIPAMLSLGRAMHAESPQFRAYSWSDSKMAALIEGLIQHQDGLAVVATDGGRVVGGVLGIITEQFFSYDRLAQDYAIFVEPGRRGAHVGRELVEAFKTWARHMKVPAVLGVSTGIKVEATCQLLESCGFERFGYLYAMKDD